MYKRYYIIIFILIIVVSGVILGTYKWFKLRASSSIAPCVNRLRIIESAKEQWSLNNLNTDPMMDLDWKDIRPYLPDTWTNKNWVNGRPLCPEGGMYSLGKLGEPPKCSIGGEKHSILIPTTRVTYSN